MKRIYLSILILVSFLGAIYAQGEMDVYKMSQRELTGTARSVGMGGAFGALGGDISGIAINPAGIGIYTSAEIVATMNFQNTKVENNFEGNKFDESKFRFRFDNLAFVSGIDLDSEIAPRLNVGFSYNKLKSFDRNYRAMGTVGPEGSLTDYMAKRAYGYEPSQLDEKYWGDDWLAVQGYNTYLINPYGIDSYGNQTYISSLQGLDADNNIFVREKGSISSYDFNVGTTISDMLSIGLTLSVTDIDYKMYSLYTENFYNQNSKNWRASFNQITHLKTEGTGFQVGLGLIFKPIKEFRLGISYHSPTWYDMTDYYTSDIHHNLKSLVGKSGFDIPEDYKRVKDPFKSNEGIYDYKMYTPDKWTFSAAGIIANMAIISIDYELSDYRNMRLKDYSWNDYNVYFEEPKQYVKKHFKLASTLRVGAEIKPIPQFSIRAGYSFQESPLEKSFRKDEKEVMVKGPIAHYVLDGHINNYSYGLGYRFTRNFYTDIAFTYKTQNSYLYNIPVDKQNVKIIGSSQYKMKNTAYQALLTLGYKF